MATVNLPTIDLNDFMQDANGADTYDANKAIFSHLPASKHFIISNRLKEACSDFGRWDCKLVDFGKKDGADKFLNMSIDEAAGKQEYLIDISNLDMLKMLASNYIALVTSGEDAINAWVIAALRARWFNLGCLFQAIDDPGDLDVEHRIAGAGMTSTNHPSDTIWLCKDKNEVLVMLEKLKYLSDFAKAYNSEEHGYKWVIKHAENIWAAVECVIKTRSHHMKTGGKDGDSYEALYHRILRAAFEGNFELPDNVEWLSVCRTAIHCFMIESLPVMTSKFIAFKKVGASTVMRLSGGPCGCAQITTAAAALDTMSGEIWYDAFKKAYGESVNLALKAKDIILDDKYSYHIAAPLYGLKKKTTVNVNGKDYQVSEIISLIQNVAAAAQGMINALESAKAGELISDYALSNARALRKSASQAPLVQIRIKTIVEHSIDEITDAKDFVSAIKAAFPKLTDVKDEKVAKKTTT